MGNYMWLTVQHRFSKKRYRVSGYAAGFYRLAGITDDDRFSSETKTVCDLFMGICYRHVTTVSLGRLTRKE
jgi:hypothetical protein